MNTWGPFTHLYVYLAYGATTYIYIDHGAQWVMFSISCQPSSLFQDYSGTHLSLGQLIHQGSKQLLTQTLSILLADNSKCKLIPQLFILKCGQFEFSYISATNTNQRLTFFLFAGHKHGHSWKPGNQTQSI